MNGLLPNRSSVKWEPVAPATSEILEKLVDVGAEVEGGSCVAQMERLKQTVTSLDELAFDQSRPVGAIKRYAGDVYIRRHPMVADRKPPLLTRTCFPRFSHF
jgi:hypothetical protein